MTKNQYARHPAESSEAAIPLFKVFMPESVAQPLLEVLFSGYVGEGPVAEKFAGQLALRLHNPHIVTVNNGTAAIQLALRLSDVGPGDEVISTPMTCVATNQPILSLGAKVVWADIDPCTGNIDAGDVEKKITRKTKAIVCVHWGGYPCDLKQLNEIAAHHGIPLIEDACHAFGSVYRQHPIGSHSDFVCFSFQAVKMLTTIDGGALACRSEDDFARARSLRWYGIDRSLSDTLLRGEGDITEYGYKFHMNDPTASIGLHQLGHVDENIRAHRKHAALFSKAFSGLNTLSPMTTHPDRQSNCWLYTLSVADRPKFAAAMQKGGIQVSPVHLRNDRYSVFRDARSALPGVDAFASRHICIPVGWWLSDDDVARIIEEVLAYDRSQQ